MRVLVTGGAGYLGSVLTVHLLNEGHHVTVLDNFMYGQMPLNHLCTDSRFRIINGDARDTFVMKSQLMYCDVVIPLAALVGAPLCERDRVGASTTNVDAVRMLARMMSPNQMLLIPISNSGYGVGEPGAECTEDSPLRPVSYYGQTKVLAEQAALNRPPDEHGIPNTISFRLATLFGASPRMRTDLLVNDFVLRAVTDKAVILFEADFKRNYLHVRDAARAFVHGINNFDRMRGQVYNAGLSSANLSKRELCAKIAEHVPGFVALESPVGEDPDKRNYVVSNAKIEATGWKPLLGLDDGIRELVKCYAMMKKFAHGNV